MINFSAILRSDCVGVGVDAASKDDALVAAVDCLVKGRSLPHPDKLLAEVRARELLSSTGIGEGVAVPHALCDAVPETVMSVVRLSRPVDFASLDGQPVDLLFLMAGPRGDTANHLKLLSKLARLLHDEDFRTQARSVPDGAALAKLLYDRD